MLILTLRVNESILIPTAHGGEIEIMPTRLSAAGLRIQGGQVKLGIRAPRHVRIRRGRKLAPLPKRGRTP